MGSWFGDTAKRLRDRFDMMLEFGDFGELDKNTTVQRGPDGILIVRYYDTDIIMFARDNALVNVNIGNYNTPAAIYRINALCAPLIAITSEPGVNRPVRRVNGVKIKRRAMVAPDGSVKPIR